jgi:hypothetical protein
MQPALRTSSTWEDAYSYTSDVADLATDNDNMQVQALSEKQKNMTFL